MAFDPAPDEFDITRFNGIAVSEDMAARAFAEVYKGRLAFCHSRGKWYEFNDHTWVVQETPIAFHYARELSRRISAIATAGGQMQKTRFWAGVERACQADPIFSRTFRHWDTDQYLLGTPGGTMDLRTGELRTSRPTDYISKATLTIPDEFEDCPTWFSFLEQATNGDESLQRFLQQIAGYCLTGDTSEQCLFFIHGQGGRGKGVFLNTIRSVMGDYAITSAMETFEASKSIGHSTSIAMLNGARMVTASETEEGRAWAEARIKQFTGQDPITARFMRQDDFTFDPQFKLMIIGNHQPSLKTVDEAMKRRFNMIPFTVKPKKKDTRLTERLKKEWPGILRWMIAGCIDWQANGFIRPEVVVKATEEYFADQDMFGQWLQEYCEVDFNSRSFATSATELFVSWSKFAKANGEEPGVQKTFGQALARAQFPRKRTGRGMFYACISLRDFRDQAPDTDPF